MNYAHPIAWNSVQLSHDFLIDKQQDARVAVLADGRFAVVWADDALSLALDDQATTNIMARIYDPFGATWGAEFVVGLRQDAPIDETYPFENKQEVPVVAALENGGFVIGWMDWDQEDHAESSDIPSSDGEAGSSVRARVFDAAGQSIVPSGEPDDRAFQINNKTTMGNQVGLELHGVPGGGFVAVWYGEDSTGEDTQGLSIHARRYDSDFNPIGDESIINTKKSGTQAGPAVDVLEDGTIVMVWTDGSGLGVDSSGLAVRVRLFDHTESADQALNYDLHSNTGDAVVNFVNSHGEGAAFAESSLTDGHQENPDVAALSGGGYVVVWEHDSSWTADDSHQDHGVRVGLFDAEGEATASQFFIDTYNEQFIRNPKVAGLPGGGFVVIWEFRGPVSSSIVGQVFDASGNAVGDQFFADWDVFRNREGEAQHPALAVLPDGRFVVSWTAEDPSNEEDHNSQQQIFDPRGKPLIASGNNTGEYFAGTRFADKVFAGGGDDFIIGGRGADILDGGAGNDLLMFLGDRNVKANLNIQTRQHTGWGNDRLRNIEDIETGDGNDTLKGNSSSNIFMAYGGQDFLAGRRGKDILYGMDGNDILRGGRGTDLLHGGAGRDILRGGLGREELNGGMGADLLVGGQGSDTAAFNSGADIRVDLRKSGRQATGEGNDLLISIENLTTGDGDDSLIGDRTLNALHSGAGADRLWGKGGKDILNAGADDDFLHGGAGADQLTGGEGSDTASYAGSAKKVDVDLSRGTGIGGQAQGDRLEAIENLIGSSHNDTLTGDGNDNIIEGGDGADELKGGEGADALSYAGSAQRVIVNLAAGTAVGGDADGDTFSGFSNLIGSANDDILTGLDDGSTIDGGAGNDELFGGDGVDTLIGGAGDDSLTGGGGGDFLDGGAGSDWASYAASSSSVEVDLANGTASGGHATSDELINMENIIGSVSNDTLTGDGNINRLLGGAGNDRLTGGDGGDYLDGGANQDWASYTDSSGAVTVNLLTGTGSGGDAEGDQLIGIENLEGSINWDTLIGDDQANILSGLGGVDTYTGNGGADRFVFIRQKYDTVTDFEQGIDRLDFSKASIYSLGDLNLTVYGGDTLIRIDGHVRAILEGFTATLVESDFIFTAV